MLATVLPEDAGIKDIAWSVDKPLWASIDASGLVTALRDGTVQIIARAIDGSGIEGRMSITQTNQSVGILRQNPAESKIYPNPATDRLYFKTPDEVSSIQISNIQGVLFRNMTIQNEENSIDISDLEKGLYFLSIHNNLGEKINYLFMKN